MSLAQSAFGDFEHEFANTRRMIERVPEAHLDYQPHEKSFTLRRLVNHCCDFGMWGAITINQDVLDFAIPRPPEPPMNTAADFLKKFDEGLAAFRAAMANVSDSAMMDTWTMKNGERVFMAMPRLAVLRNFVISHMIHHRAQLTMYYRAVGVSVPGLYGPSADEQ